MIKTLSWNVNGIRACSRQGFVEFLSAKHADVIGLQEVRASEDQVPEAVRVHSAYPYQFHVQAEKKGYSGVALLTNIKPEEVVKGLENLEYDREGRVITGIFSNFIYLSVYFPNSQDKGKRIAYKLAFCEALTRWTAVLEKSYPARPIILAGDYNIAHQEIDIARPDSNQGNAGFLPDERNWMTTFLADGWTDTYRTLHPNEIKYSWWSAFHRARAKNLGWRIDYHATKNVPTKNIKKAEVWSDVLGSDHCPVTLEVIV